MRRLNSDGIDRSNLLVILRSGYEVRRARERGLCLLCRSGPVGAAGLCEGCLACLTEEELEAARRWIEGVDS